jgi:hypothetical protein
VHFSSDFFAQALGSKYGFQSYRFTFSKYGSLSEHQVLAYNLFLCGTGGSPPFYGNCIYGANNELRGYRPAVIWTVLWSPRNWSTAWCCLKDSASLHLAAWEA